MQIRSATDHSDSRPYLVARLNHALYDDTERLADAVSAISDTEIDAISVPTHRANDLVSPLHASEAHESIGHKEITKADIQNLSNCAGDYELEFIPEVYHPDRVDWLTSELDVHGFKIHGGDITYKRFLKYIGKFDYPIILSTTAATESEIKRAVEWIGHEHAIIVCYEPCHDSKKSIDTDLNRLKGFMRSFDRQIGYIDRSGERNFIQSILANGVRYLELSVSQEPGSADGTGFAPDEIDELIESITNTSSDGESTERDDVNQEIITDTDQLSDDERQFRTEKRRSLMASQSLSAGATLSDEMVTELRPGSGLPADRIDDCIGMLIQRPTDPREMITY